MTPEGQEVLDEIKRLQLRLESPIDEGMRAGGWRQESATKIISALGEFGKKIQLIGELPPMSERPWDMARGLDSHGVHGGGPFNELVEFGQKLRRLP